MLGHIRDFVKRRLALATPKNDGKQTLFRGHPDFVAQHATATCCCGMLSKWHGVPSGQQLSATEQAHVVKAIACWLRAQNLNCAREQLTVSEESPLFTWERAD
ncbi:uncharacterized protein DUF4186 [Methylorubrum extorquens]|jgi:hypothetical protein